ncbi:unnamed protein product, partial [Brachionus calyciflorus]
SDYYANKSFRQVTNDLDARRKKVKELLNKQIDDYYDELIKNLKSENSTKKSNFKQSLENIEKFDNELKSFKIKNEEDFETRKREFEEIISKVRNKLDEAKKLVNEIKGQNFNFVSGDENLVKSSVEKIFGDVVRIDPSQNILEESSDDDIPNIKNYSKYAESRSLKGDSSSYKSYDEQQQFYRIPVYSNRSSRRSEQVYSSESDVEFRPRKQSYLDSYW